MVVHKTSALNALPDRELAKRLIARLQRRTIVECFYSQTKDTLRREKRGMGELLTRLTKTELAPSAK